MARWESKLKRAKNPPDKILSAYELKDALEGEVCFVLAPGPSLDEFPRGDLDRFVTIGVNSLLEIYRPTYWIFQEGIFCKKYKELYSDPKLVGVVAKQSRTPVIQKFIEKPTKLYWFTSDRHRVLTHKRTSDIQPFWYREEESFLPGHCSISANAISLARLMNPRLIVLVGIDLRYDGAKYYADGVKRNSGPRLRDRALSASRAWMSKAARFGVWKGAEIVTSSSSLSLRGVKRKSADQILEMAGMLIGKKTWELKSQS